MAGLGRRRGDGISETIHFFHYDTVEISLLLTGIILIVTVLRSFMSIERTRALLGGKRESLGNIVAAGIPVRVTMSFLIASPMVNEIAIGLLLSLFGWQVTVVHVATGCLFNARLA